MNRIILALLLTSCAGQSAFTPLAGSSFAVRESRKCTGANLVIVDAPTQSERSCAKRVHEPQWLVGQVRERPLVALNSSACVAITPSSIDVPPHLDHPGRRTVIQLRDGWLIGFDAGGEGGGRLTWLSQDKTFGRVLDDGRQIVGVFPQGERALAVASSLVEDAGEVLVVDSLQRSIVARAQIDSEPRVATSYEGNGVLIVADEGVFVATEAGVSRLSDAAFGDLSPSSVVVSPDGTIRIGLLYYVAELRREGAALHERWFAPATTNACVFRYADYIEALSNE